MRVSKAGNCFPGVLFVVTIMFDEVRPKVLCIHTKLNIVCRRLRAVEKESLFGVFAAAWARIVKMFYFAWFIMNHLQKASWLDNFR